MGKNHQEKPMKTAWVRIPDGIRVKHRHEGLEGFIDGLTEFCHRARSES
jgi:hypothetical protein